MKQLKKLSMVMALVLSVFCFAACSDKTDTNDNTTENNDATDNTDTTKNKDAEENKDTTENKKDTTGNNATNNDATTDRYTTGTDNNSMDGTVNGTDNGEGYLERVGEDVVDGVEDFGDAIVGKDKNNKTGNTDADANSAGTQSNQ